MGFGRPIFGVSSCIHGTCTTQLYLCRSVNFSIRTLGGDGAKICRLMPCTLSLQMHRPSKDIAFENLLNDWRQVAMTTGEMDVHLQSALAAGGDSQ